MLELRGLPGPARQDPLPPGPEGQAALRPHTQRLGRRGGPDPRRDLRAVPAVRRDDRGAAGAAPIHGRPRTDRVKGCSMQRLIARGFFSHPAALRCIAAAAAFSENPLYKRTAVSYT